MPMPKSVVKIKKNGVQYTSNVDKCQYTIHELTRAALRDVGKFLRGEAKKKAPKDSGNLRKNIGSWVRKDKNGKAWLQVGVYDKKRAKKKGLKYAFYAMFLEFGTKGKQAQPFLKPSAFENQDKIREIQSKYLSYIEDERKALSLIDESEEIKDD